MGKSATALCVRHIETKRSVVMKMSESRSKNQLKILYVNAVDVTNLLERGSGSLAFGYLTSSVRAKLGATKCLFRVVDSGIPEALDAWEPDLVAISVVSQNYGYAIEAAVAARERGVPVVIGGIHISMLPECLNPAMTVAVIGEGERTFVELVAVLLEEGRLDRPEVLNKIRGIAYWDGERIVCTERGPLTVPLDEIDHPARDFSVSESGAILVSSRGCPYRCVFCCSSRYWGRMRLFSAEYVAEEMRSLVERYRLKRLIFFDDLFVWDRNRLGEIVQRFEADSIFRDVSITCTIRAELVDDELAVLLKRLHVDGVGAGLESGSQQVLEYLKGPKASVEQNRHAIEILRKHGISTDASFIIGAPEETTEDARQTVQFIKDVRLRDFMIHVLTPFPGTPLWDEAVGKGIVSAQMEWTKLRPDVLNHRKRDVLLAEKMSYEEVKQFFDEINGLRMSNARRWRRNTIMRKVLRQPHKVAASAVRRAFARAP